MDKKSLWKWLIFIGLTAWSLAIVLPLKEKVKLGLDLQGGTRFVLQVDLSEMDSDAARDAQSRAMEVIRNRVDAMGVAEPVIYGEPGNRIIVEIPGLKTEDRERAIKNIQSAAYLEFRMVHPDNDRLVDELLSKGLAPEGYRIVSLNEGGDSQYYKRDKSRDPAGVSEEDIRKRAAAFHAPAGYELLMERVRRSEQDFFRPAFVNRRADLKGESISSAGVDYDMVQRPVVTMRFDSKGAKRFATLTGDYAPGGAKNPGNRRRQLGIVLDGVLYSAPNINSAILGGSAQIEGNFSLREAQDLALVLRAGALPAPVKLLEERTVDPTLGQDSVNSGKKAVFVGCGVVMAFMLVYYMLAGVVASAALITNIVLLPVGLIITGGFLSLLANTGAASGISLPTLTLPGIAGIALTIGMAVDANVLIFERMREEQKAGKRFKFIVDAGYNKAFSAIFDSNITTLLAAVILFWQGTGPIRGFAVMLSAGLIVSMYTALVVTRMVFDQLVARTNIQQLKMLQFFGDTKIDFVRISRYCIALSLVVIVASWAMFVKNGRSNFGVDFLGGASITFQFNEKAPMEDLRAALSAEGINASLQYQKASGADGSEVVHEYLEIKTEYDSGKPAADLIAKQFADKGYRVLKEDSVGPQIGEELQRKAIIATLLALGGMIIYVSIRFEFPYAVGAVAALLHDVLIAVGLFCALGGQLDLTMVAAVLTIIGYSVNDTIVVFDRIRENLKLEPGKSFADIANAAINQTLSRTVLTAATTLFTVVALLVFGGGAIYELSMLLFIGMVAGVYSSVVIATPIAMIWSGKLKAKASAK
ncbi:MAG: protein translocase subunit SecD [Kiritimatiellae bacterium]|nr:protein translocase subunit SecD [Kiritimatiellia bacterium]MCO5068187.1 protein translocase subunit SecD [Kiritimatiellia bacterium]